jgi:hypothetical protein
MRRLRTALRRDPSEIDDPLYTGPGGSLGERLRHLAIAPREVAVAPGLHRVDQVVRGRAAVERLLEARAGQEVGAHDVDVAHELRPARERAHGPPLRHQAVEEAAA